MVKEFIIKHIIVLSVLLSLSILTGCSNDAYIARMKEKYPNLYDNSPRPEPADKQKQFSEEREKLANYHRFRDTPASIKFFKKYPYLE